MKKTSWVILSLFVVLIGTLVACVGCDKKERTLDDIEI